MCLLAALQCLFLGPTSSCHEVSFFILKKYLTMMVEN